MEGRGEEAPGAHVLLLPYPTQGHVNPMLEFGKRLVAHGLRATVAVTRFIANMSPRAEVVSSVRVAHISDGCDSGGCAEAESIKAYLDGFREVGSRTLAGLIGEEAEQGRPVGWVVYDSFLPWGLEVAKGLGLRAAAFFTQTCTVDAFYYHACHGRLGVPPPGPSVWVEGVGEVAVGDLPSLISAPGPYKAYLEMVVNQFSNVKKADAVFINSFYQLEPQAADWMASLFPAKTIGPTIPSGYLDNPEGGDKHYGFDLCASDGRTCTEWLDSQEPASVVYVSFGSLSTLGAQQMEELAWGLTASGKRFLWVVRGAEGGELPASCRAAEAGGKGLVVPWCGQLEVLAHPSVGCFLTHCGWNSTLEGLCLGVPMVAVPQWTDQPTNAKWVEAVWGTGVRAVAADEGGVVRRDEVERRIREVMEGARGEEIKKNARNWRKLAVEAISDGGTSHRNIRQFVDAVIIGK